MYKYVNTHKHIVQVRNRHKHIVQMVVLGSVHVTNKSSNRHKHIVHVD
eukprot:COSAG01_NODE_1332_length_10695_cov_19.161854_3_plen_48_part_00